MPNGTPVLATCSLLLVLIATAVADPSAGGPAGAPEALAVPCQTSSALGADSPLVRRHHACMCVAACSPLSCCIIPCPKKERLAVACSTEHDSTVSVLDRKASPRMHMHAPAHACTHACRRLWPSASATLCAAALGATSSCCRGRCWRAHTA